MMSENLPELGNKCIDYLTTTLAAIAPVVGPIIAEVVREIIPGQRLDRIEKYAQILNSKISHLSYDSLRLQLNNENFTDLLEDGLRQSAKSTSDERKEYIASIVANGIASDKIDFFEIKQLLRILGEINDIEVIWLRFYMVEELNGDTEFREAHSKILEPILVYLGLDKDAPELEKAPLQWSYKEHLAQLGLLEIKHEIDRKTGLLKIDRDGQFKVKGYELTSLGRLLLKYIGLTDNGFTPKT